MGAGSKGAVDSMGTARENRVHAKRGFGGDAMKKTVEIVFCLLAAVGGIVWLFAARDSDLLYLAPGALLAVAGFLGLGWVAFRARIGAMGGGSPSIGAKRLMGKACFGTGCILTLYGGFLVARARVSGDTGPEGIFGIVLAVSGVVYLAIPRIRRSPFILETLSLVAWLVFPVALVIWFSSTETDRGENVATFFLAGSLDSVLAVIAYRIAGHMRGFLRGLLILTGVGGAIWVALLIVAGINVSVARLLNRHLEVEFPFASG